MTARPAPPPGGGPPPPPPRRAARRRASTSGWRASRVSAWAWIWRTRSRLRPSSEPISCSVRGARPATPKRLRTTWRLRGSSRWAARATAWRIHHVA